MKKVYLMFTLILFIHSLMAQEDSYHNWIKSHLTTEYSIIGGQWVLTDKEITTNSLAQLTNIQQTITDWSSEEPFTKKVKFTNTLQRTNPWDAAVRYPTQIDITAGDALLLIIWIRALTADFGNGMISHIFEKSSDPYTKSLLTSHLPSNDWQMWMLPFESEETYSAGTARYQINMGVMAQTIDVGGIVIINYGTDYSVEELPITEYHKNYEGQEPDAAWRTEAQARIEQYRMENLTVTVVDADDDPIEGAVVNINMKKHKFGFGTAVAVSRLIGTDYDADVYREKLQDLSGNGKSFNLVVIENALKWPTWESTWPTDKQGTADAITTLRNWDLKVRGHNLVWPGWNYLPDDIEANSNNPDYITQRIQEHITEIAGYPGIKGEIFEWDVINEAVHNHDLANVYGTEDVYKDWFDLAEAADPDAKLFLNDYSIINNSGMDFSSQEKYHSLIQNLLNAGAKLEGIGIQGHFQFPLTSPQRIYEIIEDFAVHDLDIEITEYDTKDVDDHIAANYIRDVMTIAFSHPKVTQFLMWGFWDGAHYKNQAPIFYSDWTIKLSGEMFINLVFNQWWTDASLISDNNGNVSVNGYLGDYDITAEYDGYSENIAFSLDKGNGTVTIKLDGVTDVGDNESKLFEFKLNQNYPNPFNLSTTIQYSIPNSGRVVLKIYDVLGKEVHTLVEKFQVAGNYDIHFDAKDLPGGIYLYTLQIGNNFTETKKMMFLK